MKTPKDLINQGYQQLRKSSEQSLSDRQQEKPATDVMEKLWMRMSEIYGRAFVSQYGSAPTESWERLLTGISPQQIARGLEGLLTWNSDFPPNAVQFRSLCLGELKDKDGHDISHYHKSAAYIDIHDPKSPAYRPKMLEDLKSKDKNVKQGNETLSNLKDLFK